MTAYELSPLAEGDLDAIWLYLDEHASAEIADNVVDEIVAGFAMLARHPQAGRARPDLAPDVRSLPVGSYIVYYREAEDGVLIARVLHGSRDQAQEWNQPCPLPFRRPLTRPIVFLEPDGTKAGRHA